MHHNNLSSETHVNNWLGFSLSPHMKMEALATSDSPHLINTSYQTPTLPISARFNFTSSHHSPLPLMPVKSDGSLCLMETHPQDSSPEVEDFIGGAKMGAYQSDAMVCLYSQYLGSNTDQIPQISGAEFPCLKTWIPHEQALENQVINNTGIVQERSIMGRGELQHLSLSMSPGSQSSCITDYVSMESRKTLSEKIPQKPTVHRKSIYSFGHRTSQYRGVTRHRWTGRYEAHLWDNSCKKEGQTRKGKQVYLGGYDNEEKAARAYDLAALKYWGNSTYINFQLENYCEELEEMKNMSRQEYVAHLRRKSSGFSRGASMYRGVTRHHHHGRWQARIGRVSGNKDLYLGTFGTQEEAAEAYDVAAIKFRGVNAVTNFNISQYDVAKIMASETLPIGETTKQIQHDAVAEQRTVQQNPSHQPQNHAIIESVGKDQNPVGLHDLISMGMKPVFISWNGS